MQTKTENPTLTVDVRSILESVARITFGGQKGRVIRDQNRVVGMRYETSDAITCYLYDLVSSELNAPGGVQTTHVFETIERILKAEGMEFSHLVRTWFYMDRILDWYDEFNQARTQFLSEHQRLNSGVLPASTGIGIANQFGAGIIAGALAIKPKSKSADLYVREIASPLQRSALEYKSSFSRAVEVQRAGRRELYISGTASINPEGATVHLGDVDWQIGLSMNVIVALLQSCGLDWNNTTRAIAYFKHPKDRSIFYEYLCQHGLEKLPLTWMHADICRPDLLFEIEIDAAEVV